MDELGVWGTIIAVATGIYAAGILTGLVLRTPAVVRAVKRWLAHKPSDATTSERRMASIIARK